MNKTSRTVTAAVFATMLAGISSVAVAQGTPPNPASPNIATGVGTTDSQGTPKGETGTPYANPAVPNARANRMNTGAAPMAAPAGGDTMAAPMRRAPRADRN